MIVLNDIPGEIVASGQIVTVLGRLTQLSRGDCSGIDPDSVVIVPDGILANNVVIRAVEHDAGVVAKDLIAFDQIVIRVDVQAVPPLP